jgi:hypothetical protein
VKFPGAAEGVTQEGIQCHHRGGRSGEADIAVMGDLEFGAINDDFGRGEEMLEGREKDVAEGDLLDESEEQLGAEGQGLLVKFGPAADEDFALFAGEVDLVQAGDGLNAGDRRGGAGEDDRGPVGEGFADGLEGFPAHDDDVASGHAFEPLKILGQVPGDSLAVSDNAVEGHGGNGFEVIHECGDVVKLSIARGMISGGRGECKPGVQGSYGAGRS